jgi:hypothetical protein
VTLMGRKEMDKVLLRKSGGKRSLGRRTCNWQDITTNLKITRIVSHPNYSSNSTVSYPKLLIQQYSVTSQITHPTVQCHIQNYSSNSTVSHPKLLIQQYSVTSQITHPTVQCHIPNPSPNNTVTHHISHTKQ